MVINRKRHSTQAVEQEPKAKIKCEISKKSGDSKNVKSKPLKNDLKKSSQTDLKKSSQIEKPNWMEFKKKKKELRKIRKEQKCPIFDVTNKSKRLWEKVRRSDCPQEEQRKLNYEIHNLLKNKMEKVVYSHDLSRIVQWLLKSGPPEMREVIIEELTRHVPAMLQSKYACFCVKRMMKYGSHKSRKLIIQSLHGSVVKLTSNHGAAPIVEYIYSEWSNAFEKKQLQQEFYGDMYKHDKENDIHSLADIFKKTPNMKEAILSTVKANMSRILDKKLTNSSLFHTVLCDFLKHCSEEDRDEVLLQIQSSFLDFSNTKDGTHIALTCIWHASNKAKKIIMKGLKGHMMRVAKSEYGHLILLALFDAVDDTVLFNKMLMPELLGDLWNLASDEYGRKVVLYLVAHRDLMYFHPMEVNLLKSGSARSNSKKDLDVRKSELLNVISDPLLETISSDIGNWLGNSSIAMVTLAVLKSGKGVVLEHAFETVAEYAADMTNKITEEDNEYFIVEHAGTHLMLKKLIQYDKERFRISQVTFSSVLVSKLAEVTLLSWIKCNRGCFLLVAMMESEIQPVVREIKRKLQPLQVHIKKETSTGAQILYKKMFSVKVNKCKLQS